MMYGNSIDVAIGMKIHKTILLFFIGMMLLESIMAQAPPAIRYQAVLRDASGGIYRNSALLVRLTLLQGAANGTPVYSETHSVTTDQNGYYSLSLGSGTPVLGSFASIDWEAGPYYVLRESDPRGQSGFFITTSQQLVSTPYVLLTERTNHFHEQQRLFLRNDSLCLSGNGGSVPILSSVQQNISHRDTIGQSITTASDSSSFAMYVDSNFNRICLASCSSLQDLQRRMATVDSLINQLSELADSLLFHEYVCVPMDSCRYEMTVASDGLLPGVFSVSRSRKIGFSQGNLQYQASTNTWRFAACQSQYVGECNSQASPDYDGWIDLFAWATSGYHNPNHTSNIYYFPYPVNGLNDDTGPEWRISSGGYGPPGMRPNIDGENSNYDWGVYNAISNGGNRTGMWRTPADVEWNYLMWSRAASTIGGVENARFCKAEVCGVNGIVLFPDSFNYPASLPFPRYVNNTYGCDYSANNFDADAWQLLEAEGAVFLPASGLGAGTQISEVDVDGRYWLATGTNSWDACHFHFRTSGVNPNSGVPRGYRMSVRLIRDIDE